MLPLTFAKAGEHVMVVSVGGNPEIRKHLGDLGFVPGTAIDVVSSHEGDVIVTIRESRLAITREMASKIKVEGGKQS